MSLGLNVLGQTYTATFNYADTSLLCTQDLDLIEWYCTPLTEYYWNIKSDGSILSEIIGPSTSITLSNLPVKNSYDVLMGYYCSGMHLDYLSCDPGSQFKTDQIIAALKDGNTTGISLSSDRPAIWITDFKPNGLLIKNLDNNLICAGQQLELQCFPDGFPKEAYHWQYSLDNKLTWIDVPTKIVNGSSINDSKVSKFTIYDILGDDHINHSGPIDFRIGYADRSFSTNTIQINYSLCAPVTKKIEYLSPLCFADNVRDVTVTFDRNLYSGEELRFFQLKAVDPATNLPDGTPSIIYPFFSEGDPNNGLIKKFDEKNPGIYTFSLLNFKGLNPNATYQIQYQAFQDNVTKGVTISPKTENFKYTEPEPLKFEIKKADNPLCNNDLAEVSIAVTGGTGDYKFYVDGVEKTSPKPAKETDGYYHIRELVPTATNSIKVMDENDCIERTP